MSCITGWESRTAPSMRAASNSSRLRISSRRTGARLAQGGQFGGRHLQFLVLLMAGLDVGDDFGHVQIVARAQAGQRFVRLKRATGAAANVIAAEQGALRAGKTSSTRVIVLAASMEIRSLAKKFLNFRQHFRQAVHFRRGVVKIKTGARGRFHAQLFHQRLVAMVAAAQRHAALIGHRDDVVGVNVCEAEN